MVTKLCFEAPKTTPLATEQVSFITEFLEIVAENREADMQSFLSAISGDPEADIQPTRLLPEAGDLMKQFGGVSFLKVVEIGIENRPIYHRGDEETTAWHSDSSLSSPYKFIGLASLVYPTEFASCDIELSAPHCTQFMNDQTEEMDWFEDEFDKFSPSFADTFLAFSKLVEQEFGYDWLEAANLGEKNINKLVKVKNLAVQQTLPGVLAYGYSPAILHRKPAEPRSGDRYFFRIFSKDLIDETTS